MKIISFLRPLPISDPECFLDLTAEKPVPGPRDLLVEVRAIGVNPVDTKIRQGGGPAKASGELPILGWDAAGVVQAIGSDVTLFAPGDKVYYAGSVDRPGCYAEFQCVDERIVGHKPQRLSFAESAAMPLTTITAWEMMFDRLKLSRTQTGSLLVVGGAGGVGSIAIQLARQLTPLQIIATASRVETDEWCRRMGAHHVVNHAKPLGAQVKALVSGGVSAVLALTKTEDHFEEIIEAMAPQSAIALIENPGRPLEITRLKPKSISLHWEFMFTRSRFQTADLAEQGQILNRTAELIDAGQLQTTLQTDLGPITAAHLREAHALVESGRTIGKIVLSNA